MMIPLNFRNQPHLDREDPKTEKLQFHGSVYCLPLQIVVPFAAVATAAKGTTVCNGKQ